MATIVSNALLINGLRNEFVDTYERTRIKQADSKLSLCMDLSVTANNRNHDYAYIEAAPHVKFWPRGETIPTSAMLSKTWNVPIYEWAMRVPWSKWDRKDDQTGSLVEMAKQAATSAALLPERMFFDLLTGGTSTLPATVTASDGANLFITTSRFGQSAGNELTPTGVSGAIDVLRDYYLAMNLFRDYQDGQGQPLHSGDVIDQGTVVVYPLEMSEVMEMAFLQKRTATGISAAGDITGTLIGAAATTNLTHDSGKDVTLWPSPRLTVADDWYIFLKGAKKSMFYVTREEVQEFSSLEGDNNGDHTRDTAEEYIQWEQRSGAGIGLPYDVIKMNT